MPLGLLAAVQTFGYINPWKLLPAIILLLVWLRAMTWIDKDAPDAHLPREIMNAGMISGLILGYALFILLPGYGPAIGALLLCFLADIGVYLGVRAKVVGLKDLKESLANEFASITGKNKPKKVVAVAGEVQIIAKGGSALEVPDAEAAERRPYDAAQVLLAKPLRLHFEKIDLAAGDPSKVSYLVDGVRYDGPGIDRETTSTLVQYLKGAAGMDLGERRKPQTGMFKAALEGKRTELKIITAGNTAGESMQLTANPKKRHEFKIDSIGLGEDQLAALQKMVTDGSGVVLLCAPKAQGLTSLCYAVIRAHDAFIQHIHTIERGKEQDLEGITQNELAPNAPGADEAKQVSWVISQEPDVVMLTSIEDGKSAADLAKYASAENRRAYIAMRAGSTFDALRQWRKLMGNDDLAMKSLKMIISGRLIRKLCSACKVGYSPDPAQLRKLNMSPDEVGTLYAARKEPMRDSKGNAVPCTFCYDLAFKGRTGVYEIFIIDDEVRKIIEAGGSENQLKQAFRKQRGKLIQEMALAQVKAGETSVEEVLRVLKADAPPGAAPAARPQGAGPPGVSPPPPKGPPPNRPPGQRLNTGS